MKAENVKGNLDKVVLIDGQDQGTIVGYMKGWIEVEMSDMTIRKCRAKQLKIASNQTLLQDLDEAPPTTKNEIEDFVEDKATPPSDTKIPLKKNSNDLWNVTCPACGHAWETAKSDNFICPKCRHRFVIRLHPDKEKYVVGLGETENGRDTMDIADEVAEMLRGLSLEDLYIKAAKEMEQIKPCYWFSKTMTKKWNKSGGDLISFLTFRYHKLNPGMQRMSVGNLLRGTFTRERADIETPNYSPTSELEVSPHEK